MGLGLGLGLGAALLFSTRRQVRLGFRVRPGLGAALLFSTQRQAEYYDLALAHPYPYPKPYPYPSRHEADYDKMMSAEQFKASKRYLDFFLQAQGGYREI